LKNETGSKESLTIGNLRDYQEEAVQQISKTRIAYLCSKCGSGKSVMALKSVIGFGPTLIIRPAFVCDVWVEQIGKWMPQSTSWVLPKTTSEIPYETPDFIIVSYTKVIYLKVFKTLMSYPFESIILDEAHFLKNETSKRTLSIFGDGEKKRLAHHPKLKKVILLSGTPLEKAIHLFSFGRAYNFLPPKYLDKVTFGKQFCNAYQDAWGGWHYQGTRNLEELLGFFSNSFIGIQKEKIEKALPPIQHVLIRLDICQDLVYEEKKLLPDNLYKNFNKIPQEAISKLRNIIALEKMDSTLSYVLNLAKQENKILVFCHHKVQIEEFKKNSNLFKKEGFQFFSLHGGVPIRDRMLAVKNYNESAQAIIVCSISASNVGISLHTTTQVVFSEISWSWADNEQAFCRAWRQGAVNKIQVHWISIKNSIDDWMLSTTLKKKNILDKFLSFIKSI